MLAGFGFLRATCGVCFLVRSLVCGFLKFGDSLSSCSCCVDVGRNFDDWFVVLYVDLGVVFSLRFCVYFVLCCLYLTSLFC